MTKVRFLPQWYAQAQFAGYYMAKERGFYKEDGLDVELLSGGAECTVEEGFQDNHTEFASSFLSTALKLNDQGLDLVNICQFSQKSALMFITKKSSGIQKIEDFNGKKIGLWHSDFQEIPRAFLSKNNIEAQIIDIKFSTDLFLLDGIDIMGVMYYNEYHRILNSGIDQDELECFFFHAYQYDFPEDGIYCKRSYYENNTASCQQFAKATKRGWKEAFNHPEEALNLVERYMKKDHVSYNRAHQRWMLNRMHFFFIPTEKEKTFGSLNQEQMEYTAEEMLREGIISKYPDYADFFKGNKK